MCLILFAYQVHPEYRLAVAANRDEFYQRPTRHASFWSDNDSVLAGRDLLQQGTWLGVTRQGRFAAVTNVRNGFASPDPKHQSRGQLTRDFLCGDMSPQAYLETLVSRRHQYPGYNLLVGDRQSLWYWSNHDEEPPRALQPGVYGLSNGTLDSPWPKLTRGREHLQQTMAQSRPSPQQLLELLQDRHAARDDKLPDTGVSIEWERRLAPCFISTPDYGTRASTAVLESYRGELEFVEQNFDFSGATERCEYRLQLPVDY